MVTKSSKSKDFSNPERRLLPKFSNKTPTIKQGIGEKRVSKFSKTKRIDTSSTRYASQKGNNLSSKEKFTGVLQSFVLGTQKRKHVPAYNRSQFFKQISERSNFQNGNCGNDSEIDSERRMGNLSGHHRCLLSCTDTSKVPKISQILCTKSDIPIQLASIRSRNCASRIYKHSQRGKATSYESRPSSSCVSGRLATSIKNRAILRARHCKTSRIDKISRLVNEPQKIGIDSKSKYRFCRLPFRSRIRSGVSNTEEIRYPEKQNKCNFESDFHFCKNSYVSNWKHGMHGKDCTTGKDTYASLPVVSENSLVIPPIVRQSVSIDKVDQNSSQMVVGSSEYIQRIHPSSRVIQCPDIHGCIGTRLGCSPSRISCERSVDTVRNKITHKFARIESSVSCTEDISKSNLQQKCPDTDRQLDSSVVPEQGRGHPLVSNVCIDLETDCMDTCKRNPDQSKTHPRSVECNSRSFVPEKENYSDRMVPSSANFQTNMSQGSRTSDRSICDQAKQQVTCVRFACPRSSRLGNRCIEHLLGGSGRLCLLSRGNNPTSDSENIRPPLQNCHDSSRMAGHELVLGPDRLVNPTPTVFTNVAEVVKTTSRKPIPSESRIPEFTCVASTSKSVKFEPEVEARIKAPQRQSSRKVYESRWSIFATWCSENEVDVKSPSIPEIANFLNHLFQDKSFKPSTISGYRTAIADGLSPHGENISKSSELNRLLSSFHRDRPKANKSIPTWDLSLVLLALTKSPFEPLSKASLKILTLKTVFLMALASGKRRSEIHSWTFKSFSFKRDWSEVTFSPSPAFLAKNQLASMGPSAIKQVVIPALKPTLDSSMIEDISLCPVRALKYYLDRTKDLRKDKHLVFVSFKEGFSKDISRPTISSWIKQAILLALESCGNNEFQVSQVKAHDVRGMAASLAFKGGIPLDDIMESCFWRSHNTFTNFYLRDVCWHNNDLIKLGPVVAAQQVVELSKNTYFCIPLICYTY